MAKFIIGKSSNNQHYFVLKAGNGETILVSETYQSEVGCRLGIESVRANSQISNRFRIWDNGTQYRFTLVAGNGETIGTSEIYTTQQARDNGIASVKANAPSAEIYVMSYNH